MAQLIAVMGIIAIIARYVAEWAFGKRLSGKAMQAAAIATATVMLLAVWGVARTFPSVFPELAWLNGYTVIGVVAAGIPAGFGASAFHDLLSRRS